MRQREWFVSDYDDHLKSKEKGKRSWAKWKRGDDGEDQTSGNRQFRHMVLDFGIYGVCGGCFSMSAQPKNQGKREQDVVVTRMLFPRKN